jgi:hypothetical protein
LDAQNLEVSSYLPKKFLTGEFELVFTGLGCHQNRQEQHQHCYSQVVELTGDFDTLVHRVDDVTLEHGGTETVDLEVRYLSLQSAVFQLPFASGRSFPYVALFEWNALDGPDVGSSRASTATIARDGRSTKVVVTSGPKVDVHVSLLPFGGEDSQKTPWIPNIDIDFDPTPQPARVPEPTLTGLCVLGLIAWKASRGRQRRE